MVIALIAVIAAADIGWQTMNVAANSPTIDADSAPAVPVKTDGLDRIPGIPEPEYQRLTAVPKPGSLLKRAAASIPSVPIAESSKANPANTAAAGTSGPGDKCESLCAEGLGYMKSGDQVNAIAAFTSALQEVESAPADKSSWQVGSELMDKSHLTAFLHSQRGQCYIDQQETKMAISDLSAAIEACPGDVPNYMLRGRLYQEQGNPERAIADFRKARLLQRGY